MPWCIRYDHNYNRPRFGLELGNTFSLDYQEFNVLITKFCIKVVWELIATHYIDIYNRDPTDTPLTRDNYEGIMYMFV